jgi:ornithine carbamoyltransferase
MNLLDISDLSSQQISDIFQIADRLRLKNDKNSLIGKTFVLFFPESSLRTRVSFERGIKDLGGECILFPPETLDKREENRDVINNFGNWVDGVIVRHPDFLKIQELSSHSSVPIINALTSDNHPCEILSDLYSISRQNDNFKELVYTFVGHSGNICKSWVEISNIMNLNFNHVCKRGHELGRDSINYKFRCPLSHR